MGRRTWVKIYADKWLRGTIREEPPEIRGIWVDLLTLAGDSAYGDEGIIRLAPGCGLTDEQICVILNIDNDLWQRAKQRLIETERITVTDHNEIIILNWLKYQSEYMRQKKYREKLQQKVTNESYNDKLQDKVTSKSDREKEKEKEIKNINNTLSKESAEDKPQLNHIPEKIKEKIPTVALPTIEYFLAKTGRDPTSLTEKELDFIDLIFQKHIPSVVQNAISTALRRKRFKNAPQELDWEYIWDMLKNWESIKKGRRKNAKFVPSFDYDE